MTFKSKDQDSAPLLDQEVRLQGSSISEGISIGTPFYIPTIEEPPIEFSISPMQVEEEIARYRSAIETSQEEVKLLKTRLEEENAWEGAAILDGQLQMLRDPSMTTAIEEQIREIKKNTESVFHTALQEYQQIFSKIPDPYFQERFKDIQDIARRIMCHLGNRNRFSIGDVPDNCVVLSRELSPSDIAEIQLRNITGIITEIGGETSHAAIMAKAHGIPYVANIPFKKSLTQSKMIIVDGSKGEVILNPTLETLNHYVLLRDQMKKQYRSLILNSQYHTETIDGYRVRLSANVEVSSEFEALHENGSNGVGLFRSESLFLTQGKIPSEEQQFTLYKRMIDQLKGLPIVIRTFDIGGDKSGNFYFSKKESNPYLGCRAIRLMLKEVEIFRSQLRAILRASCFGDVSILLPMISGIAEFREAKALIHEVATSLETEEGLKPRFRLGCMIEVPSAAITCDNLAKECDFLSIGTNDLVQYTLAVDRGNQSVSYLYTPAHPSVIRLIKMVVAEGRKCGIAVSMCGEMAANPRLTALLLGLGIQELSVAPRYLPVIKQAIRKTYIIDAVKLAERVLEMSTPHEIQEFLALE